MYYQYEKQVEQDKMLIEDNEITTRTNETTMETDETGNNTKKLIDIDDQMESTSSTSDDIPEINIRIDMDKVKEIQRRSCRDSSNKGINTYVDRGTRCAH